LPSLYIGNHSREGSQIGVNIGQNCYFHRYRTTFRMLMID